MTATVNINVAPLADNEVAFANAAAWNAYWSNITAEVEFNAVATSLYVPVNYNTGLVPVAFAIEDINYILPTQAMFASLLTDYNALKASYEALRTELRAGGLITNAQ